MADGTACHSPELEVPLGVVVEQEDQAALRGFRTMIGCLAGTLLMGLWCQLALTASVMDENMASAEVVFNLVPLDQPPTLVSLHSSQNITEAQKDWAISTVHAAAVVQQGKYRALERAENTHYGTVSRVGNVYIQVEKRPYMLVWSMLKRLGTQAPVGMRGELVYDGDRGSTSDSNLFKGISIV